MLSLSRSPAVGPWGIPPADGGDGAGAGAVVVAGGDVGWGVVVGAGEDVGGAWVCVGDAVAGLGAGGGVRTTKAA